MSSPFQSAVDEMKRIMQEKVDEIKANPLMGEVLKHLQALNSLEELMGQPKTTLAQIFNLQATSDTPAHTVRFDEFVGLTPLEAAKKYLKKWKDARPFKEIMEAIDAGGGKVGSEEELRTSLSRSTLEVVKIGERYGLLENYPQIKRNRKKKGKAAQSSDEGQKNDENEKASAEEEDNEPTEEPQEQE